MNVKAVVFSILIGFQIPIAYWVAGHSLLQRESGLGYIYLMTIYVVICVYFLIRNFLK